MATAFAVSIIDALLGSTLGSAGQDPGNRVALEGLTSAPRDDGALEVRIRRLEAASLRVASGPLVLEVGQLALDELVALVRFEGGRPRLSMLEAAGAECSGVKLAGPLILPPYPGGGNATGPAAAASWSLGPLAAADGTIRAEIVDAHLLFDADVTVPVRQGRIDFKDATVEHVGPDSRMGASRLGLYVDAPNGRSYLYQFSVPPVAGVEYEQSGALLGPWVTDRGSLQLQPFGEWLLRQPLGGQAQGVTEQARLLFDRTAVSGDLQLSDGRFAAPGVQADFVGRAHGDNAVRLHSQAVGRGLTVELASLSVRNAVLGPGDLRIGCDQVAGALALRLSVEGAQLRFSFDLTQMKAAGVRLLVGAQPPSPSSSTTTGLLA
ncbi:hypothetical protein [Ramlibacter sp. Leaf400]|uniref:hypothetical protein n=1 Tax=Ramlibacter sp. Leaf400 TaxID=1736365 RepID=UPI0006FC5EC1|nr:hypothetical protein [Ramlibacter sp. Leaf400]KQT11217.1 hypothetical protein ASG30_04860 [Ramlibacter sp. Leaf400]